MAPKETAKRLTELGPAELKGRRVRKYYLARARASCCSRAALTPPQEPTSNSQGAWHTGTITGPGEGGKGRPKFVSVEFDNGAQREFGLCAHFLPPPLLGETQLPLCQPPTVPLSQSEQRPRLSTLTPSFPQETWRACPRESSPTA